jgi:hypothetical protein
MAPFLKGQASGIIGSEISVHTFLAREVAQEFFRRFIPNGGPGQAVGQIIKDLRLELLARFNPLGLVYTPYCSADLHMISSRVASEASASRLHPIMRSDYLLSSDLQFCGYCGVKMAAANQSCDRCGRSAPDNLHGITYVDCSYCGGPVALSFQFCRRCGRSR